MNKRGCDEMRKRLLCAVVCMSMISSMLPITSLAADGFIDTGGHWAETQIEAWADRDVVNGDQGMFRPVD